MEPLTIKNWELGIGESPYTGFGQMTNVDIYSQPGALKISNKLVSDSNSSSIVTELITWTTQDPQQGDTYHVDRDGKLYKRDNGTDTWSVITGHGTSGANGEGIAIWKDYLFYARRSALDVYGPLSGTPAWENDWQTLESSFGYDLHPMMAAQDDFLYIGNAQYVDTVNQVLGQVFDPTDPTTYTYNAEDLELRSDYRVTCLEEQGSQIVIGTLIGINGIFNVADVFIWDGTSDSFQLNGTVRLVENGVKMMKNANNVMHAIAGTGVPRVFQFVTSQSTEAKRFNNVSVPLTRRLTLYPGSTEYKEGEVLFGIGATGSQGPNPMGVYALRNNAYVLRYGISTGRFGETNSLQIGSVKTISANTLLVAWRDEDNADEFGVDVTTENFYTDYSAFVESALYTVGTEDDPKSYEKVQVILGKPLADGDGIRIKARKDLNEAWVTVATFDTPTYQGRYSMDGKFQNVSKFVNAQFRIELTTDVDSEESPEIKEISFS